MIPDEADDLVPVAGTYTEARVSDSAKLDRVIELLTLMAAHSGALKRPKKTMSAEELKGWADVNRELGQVRAPQEGPDSSGLPPAGGDVDPKTFWSRRDEHAG